MLLFCFLLQDCCNSKEKDWTRYAFSEKDKEWQTPYTPSKTFTYINQKGENRTYQITEIKEEFIRVVTDNNRGGFFACEEGYFKEWKTVSLKYKQDEIRFIFKKVNEKTKLTVFKYPSLLYFFDTTTSCIDTRENTRPIDISTCLTSKGAFLESIIIQRKEYNSVYQFRDEPAQTHPFCYYQKNTGIIKLEYLNGDILEFLN